jgi:hypothetical protein
MVHAQTPPRIQLAGDLEEYADTIQSIDFFRTQIRDSSLMCDLTPALVHGIAPICVTVFADERLFTRSPTIPLLCPLETIRATSMATKEDLGLCLLMHATAPQPAALSARTA